MRQNTIYARFVQSQPEELLTRGSVVAEQFELCERAGCELIAAALRAGNHTRMRVTGTSMLPAIWPGDVLLVSPSDETSLNTGKVVLFLRDGRLFAHRVVASSGEKLITRGDAVPDCDRPVSAAELIGVVAGIIRDDGTMRVVISVPSIRDRVVAFAVRHSDLAFRVVLKVHQCSGLLRRGFGITGWKPVPRSH